MSDFLEDPLARLRAQALRRVHTHVTRERRLAGVTCLLVTAFICCYLPFWTVYICLVSAGSELENRKLCYNCCYPPGLLPLVPRAQ